MAIDSFSTDATSKIIHYVLDTFAVTIENALHQKWGPISYHLSFYFVLININP